MNKSLPYTSLRLGDPVIYLNHADRWVDAGTVIDDVVRWQFEGSSKPVVRVRADFDRGPIELDLDVRRLKLNTSGLDGFVRSVFR